MRQVNGKMGGEISFPKAMWLSTAVYLWFFQPLFFYIQITNLEIKFLLKYFLILMWVRGIAELIMLYKFKNSENISK